MKPIRTTAVVLLLAPPRTAARAEAPGEHAGYRMIVHPRNPMTGVDRGFLADAFLKKVSRWSNGEAIRPVDRVDSAVRERFAKTVLRRSLSAVRSYWQQQIFSGRGVPPPELDSDEAVIRFVLKYPGAIGYVSAGADIGAAKPLHVR